MYPIVNSLKNIILPIYHEGNEEAGHQLRGRVVPSYTRSFSLSFLAGSSRDGSKPPTVLGPAKTRAGIDVDRLTAVAQAIGSMMPDAPGSISARATPT